MPTLPTYQSKEQLQQVQRPNIGKQYGVGDVLGSIGQTMNEREALAQKTKLVEESNRVDRAKVNTQIRIEELDARYVGNETSFQEGEYDEELAKIQSEESGQLTTMLGMQAYELDTDLGFTQARIKASAQRVTAATTEAKEDTDILLGRMKDSETRYIDGNNLIDRKIALEIYSPKDGGELKQDTIMDWEIYSANKSPLDSKDLNERLKDPHKDPVLSKLTSKQIEDMGRQARSIHARQTYTETVKVESDKVKAQRLASDIISNPDLDPLDKMKGIKNLRLSGPNEKIQLGVLNQSLGIQQTTNNNTFAELTAERTSIDSLANETAIKEDPVGYFKRVNEFRAKVSAAYASKDPDWRIGPAHYAAMLRDIDSLTAVKTAQATGATLGKDEYVNLPFFRNEKFENEAILNDFYALTPTNRDAARRNYADYYILQDELIQNEDDTTEKRKEIFDRIAKREVDNQRTIARSIPEKYSAPRITTSPKDGDTMMKDNIEHIRRGGRWYKK